MEPIAASQSQPDQEDRQNDGEDVDRQAEQHAEQAGPYHLGAECGGAGESDGDVDGPARDSVVGGIGRERAGFGGFGDAGFGGRAGGQGEAGQRDGDVDRGGGIGGDRHVVDAQQVESGEQASEDGARGVAAVQQAVPGDAVGCGLQPADDGGKRRPHQNRRRQQADGGEESAQQEARHAVLGAGDVGHIHQRQQQVHQEGGSGDAEFQEGIDAQRMLPCEPQAGEPHTADAEAAHKGGEQEAERHGGGTDGQLQKLIPDGLVDQGGASAAGEQNEQQGKVARGVGGRRLLCRATCVVWAIWMMNAYLSGNGCSNGYLGRRSYGQWGYGT